MRWVSGGFGVWVDLGLGLHHGVKEGLHHGVKGGVWDRRHGTGQHPQHCQHHPQDADYHWGGGYVAQGLVHIYIYTCRSIYLRSLFFPFFLGGILFYAFGFLASWLFGFLASWLFGFLAFWVLGFWVFQLFVGLCGFWWLFGFGFSHPLHSQFLFGRWRFGFCGFSLV